MHTSPDISGRAFLTPSQVAELLQLDTESVYRLVKRGQLPCIRVGGRTLRIPARPLFAQLQATRSGPTQQGAMS
jgi:excisionase family DNA binding protein